MLPTTTKITLHVAKSPPFLSVPEEQIQLQQSQAVVRIFLNACLACICYERELIPWKSKCLVLKRIDDLCTEAWQVAPDVYRDFCGARQSPLSHPSQEFRILRRGRHSRADSLLDILEPVVFPAVEKGLLNSVDFVLSYPAETEADRTHQSDTANSPASETYRLAFDYSSKLPHPSSVHHEHSPQRIFSAATATRNFKLAIKELLAGLQGLPTMPRQKKLEIFLKYNSQCSSEYQALSCAAVTSWGSSSSGSSDSVGQSEMDTPSSQVADRAMSKRLDMLQKSSSPPHCPLISTLDEPRDGEDPVPLGMADTRF